MEIKEAIERLQNAAWLGTNHDREKTETAIEMAISALEKQEGKKPFYNGVNYECPYCNTTIINGVKPWYCDICGQRIEWE